MLPDRARFFVGGDHYIVVSPLSFTRDPARSAYEQLGPLSTRRVLDSILDECGGRNRLALLYESRHGALPGWMTRADVTRRLRERLFEGPEWPPFVILRKRRERLGGSFRPVEAPLPAGVASKWVRKTVETDDCSTEGQEHNLVLRFPLSMSDARASSDSYALESEDGSVRQVKKLSSVVQAKAPEYVELIFEHLSEQSAYRLLCEGASSHTVFEYMTLSELEEQLHPSDASEEQQALAHWSPSEAGGDVPGDSAEEEAVA